MIVNWSPKFLNIPGKQQTNTIGEIKTFPLVHPVTFVSVETNCEFVDIGNNYGWKPIEYPGGKHA